MRKIREFSSYAEMQDTHQKEVNDFPFIFVFAFSESEFIKKMSEEIIKRKPNCTGIKTMNGISKHVQSIGGGGYIFKEDYVEMNKMFDHHAAERSCFQKKEDNLVDAILSEMNNHEYGYTMDPYDTLIALGRSYDDFENDPVFNRAWVKAQKKCFDCFE